MRSWLPTQRQREALQHRANGLSHEQTAHEMGIEVCSLDDLLVGAKKKLEAKSTHHAIAIALRQGYIQ